MPTGSRSSWSTRRAASCSRRWRSPRASKPLDIRVPLGAGIAGRVASTGTAMNIPDAYAEPLFNRAVDQQTGYRTQTHPVRADRRPPRRRLRRRAGAEQTRGCAVRRRRRAAASPSSRPRSASCWRAGGRWRVRVWSAPRRTRRDHAAVRGTPVARPHRPAGGQRGGRATPVAKSGRAATSATTVTTASATAATSSRRSPR